MSEPVCKIPVHFIGRSTYSETLFIKEAMKQGVSRALPKEIIKKFRFGDKILVAFWSPEKKEGKKKFERTGKAKIIGYFVITGINVDHRVVEAIRPKLKIVHEDAGGYTVERGCGSYTVTGVAYVQNSLSELIELIEEYEKQTGTKVKVMVTGDFYKLPERYIESVKFTRSIAYLDPEEYPDLKEFAKCWGEEGTETMGAGEVVKIDNYVQVAYRKKKEKIALENRLTNTTLDRWMRG